MAKISSLELVNKWLALFDESFLDLGENTIKETLEKYTKNEKWNPYREEVQVKGCIFLVAVFPEEKLVYLCTHHLNLEQFKAKLVEKRDYSEHIDKIISIDSFKSPLTIERLSFFNDLPNPYAIKDRLEDNLSLLLKQIEDATKEYEKKFFEKVSDYFLLLSANYDSIRLYLLKFLAVLPSLESDQKGHELKKIFLESLRNFLNAAKEENPAPPKILLRGVKTLAVLAHFIPSSIFRKITLMIVPFVARRFIAGEDIRSATDELNELKNIGQASTLDQLGELVVSEEEADRYKDRVIQIIKGLPNNGEANSAGIYYSHVSLKVTALASDFRPEALESCYEKIAPRLSEILNWARERQVFVHIDAEHFHLRDSVFEIFKRVVRNDEKLMSYHGMGIVIQAYLRDAFKHFNEVLEFAKERNILMPIRLVKGAYWDAETIESMAHSHTAPQFYNKEETDVHFRQLIELTFQNDQYLQLCLASHNSSDHCFAEVLRQFSYQDAPLVEHQVLYNTAPALALAMTQRGWCVRNYVPIGDLTFGMAYLVRRIMENSSQVGVLAQGRKGKKLNLWPEEILETKKKNCQITRDPFELHLSKDFINCPPFEVFKENNRDIYKNMKWEPSKEGNLEVFNPSTGELLGKMETSYDIDLQLKKLKNSSWYKRTCEDRIEILLLFAQKLYFNRNELSYKISLESGKTLVEAMADVDEAIDFVHFYCREQFKIEKKNKVLPLGVTAVICPWNFPLAIPVGMTVASLVSGNTVALKSAEQTPLIAEEMVKLLYSCGIEDDTLMHFPGMGDVGAKLVNHIETSGVLFTGSKDVGLTIYKNSLGKLVNGHPKKVIAEMGGKNAAIVTPSADLDEVVSSLIYSCFAHAGQKCSAISRIFVHKMIKKQFLSRFCNAAQSLKVGDALDAGTYINPLCSKEDKDRYLETVKSALTEVKKFGGTMHLNRSEIPSSGNFVGPCIFELPSFRAIDKESWSQKEVFAPMVHIISYEEKDEVVNLFNSVEYALTGGVFSQSNTEIDYFMNKLEVGNLYINRTCTGARVGIEPFGGFKMSGTGPKAGGKHYLKQLNKILDLNEDKFIAFENIDFEKDYSSISEEIPMGKFKSFVHFWGKSQKEKEKLLEMYEFIEKKYEINPVKFNRSIPGQKSFYNLGLKKEFTFVCEGEAVIQDIIFFLMTLKNKNEILVFCFDTVSYENWERVFKYFDLNQSSLKKMNQKHFPKILSGKKLKQFVLSGDSSLYSYFENCSEDFYPKPVLIPRLETYNDFNENMWLNLFEHKNVAYSIMRHGAPLEEN